MMITTSHLAIATRYMCDHLNKLGRNVNVDNLENIVSFHALTASVAGMAAGCTTGVGVGIATAIAISSTVTMYIRLGAAMGIRFNKGLISAVVSALVAELAAEVAVLLAGAMFISFIPGLGNISSGALSAFANFCLVYLAAVIFMKMLSSMLERGVDPSSASEAEFKSFAKDAMADTDMKAVCAEARTAYKQARKHGDMKSPSVEPDN